MLLPNYIHIFHWLLLNRFLKIGFRRMRQFSRHIAKGGFHNVLVRLVTFSALDITAIDESLQIWAVLRSDSLT